MDRREFVRLSLLAAPAASVAARGLLAQPAAPQPSRTYEVTTTVRVVDRSGLTRVWLPEPLAQPNSFQRVLSSSVQAEGGKISVHEDPRLGLKVLAAEFPAGRPAVLVTTHRIATRDWAVPLGAPSVPLSHCLPKEAEEFLRPTRYVPVDGIVKRTSDEITRGMNTDLEKTRAIYAWIVKNTYRNPAVQGCGVGNIKPMLETGDLGGKCADLNGLFVGLVKAAGIPARDVYGIRLGGSALECKSLGTASDHIEKAQHCRAEVFLNGFGWVPVDAADVRKAIIEEAPVQLTLSDPKIIRLQDRLFGSWEMNWMAYNYAQDVVLPGSRGPALPFLMYPQAETSEGRLNSLDPADFHYDISSQQVGS